MALASVQGLYELVLEENRGLRSHSEQLLERLAALERAVDGLTVD